MCLHQPAVVRWSATTADAASTEATDTEERSIRPKRLAYGDRVAVFGQHQGRARRGLVGTVISASTRLGCETALTVLLDDFVDGQYALVEVAASDVVVLQRRSRK